MGVAPCLPTLQSQAAFHAATASTDLTEAGLEAGLETPPGSLDTSVKVADGDSTLQSGDGPKVAKDDEWVEVSLSLAVLSSMESLPSPGSGGCGP